MKIHAIKIESLPTVCFAHEYSSPTYDNYFVIHPNFIEIAYLMEGELQYTCGDFSQTITEGAVMALYHSQPGEVHSDVPHRHITVGINVEISEGETLLPCCAFFESDKYRDDILRIIEEYTVFQRTTLRLQSMLLKLISDLAEDWRIYGQGLSKKHYSEDRYAERAKRYIAAHIRERIYVEQIAADVGLSVGYISSLFARVTGMTLVKYIHKTKLSRIREYMDTYHTSLKEAAGEFGYSDVSYVSRIYKKYFGENIVRNPKRTVGKLASELKKESEADQAPH